MPDTSNGRVTSNMTKEIAGITRLIAGAVTSDDTHHRTSEATSDATSDVASEARNNNTRVRSDRGIHTAASIAISTATSIANSLQTRNTHGNDPGNIINTVLQKAPRPATPESVTTLLSPGERARVDAAGEGCFVTLHRESVDEVLNDLRQQRASAVLVSVAHYVTQQTPPVARLVREFPRVPAVALLTGSEPTSTHAVLSLGQQGVRAHVDVRDARGWRELRRLITEERNESVERSAITQLSIDLAGAPEDCLRFFDALFSSPPSVCTVRQLARRLGVLPSTFMSRFFRAGLPAPKSYLAMARLVRAARLFENPGLSVAQVSMQLEYSSPQSFSRHVQTLLQCSAVGFRKQYDGRAMLEHMRQEYVLPHHEVLMNFHPLIVAPGWMGR